MCMPSRWQTIHSGGRFALARESCPWIRELKHQSSMKPVTATAARASQIPEFCGLHMHVAKSNRQHRRSLSVALPRTESLCRTSRICPVSVQLLSASYCLLPEWFERLENMWLGEEPDVAMDDSQGPNVNDVALGF